MASTESSSPPNSTSNTDQKQAETTDSTQPLSQDQVVAEMAEREESTSLLANTDSVGNVVPVLKPDAKDAELAQRIIREDEYVMGIVKPEPDYNSGCCGASVAAPPFVSSFLPVSAQRLNFFLFFFCNFFSTFFFFGKKNNYLTFLPLSIIFYNLLDRLQM
jgi:hypothetical protein